MPHPEASIAVAGNGRRRRRAARARRDLPPGPCRARRGTRGPGGHRLPAVAGGRAARV